MRTARQNDWNWESFRPEWANEGIERINAELEKWTDRVQNRGEKFRKQSQKRIEKGIAQIQHELRKLPAIKRAEALRQDLGERVQTNLDAGLDRVYTRLNLARLEEVKKLDRKIAALNKKLRALEGEPTA
jgi:DNA polymerase/3'-5' exonuclease PolX